MPDRLTLQQPRMSQLLLMYLLAGSVTTLGFSVLCGWYTQNTILIQVHPSFVPMQYNTALGFFIAGCSLLATLRKKFVWAMLGGALVLLIGGLTLVEYIAEIDLGIDQLFMQHYITTKTFHPGRMAPNTALCFFLSGCILFISNLDQRFSYLLLLGSVVTGLGLIALLGYLFGLETAYGWEHLTRMAVHTSAGFIVLGIGLSLLGLAIITHERKTHPYWPVTSFAILLVVLALTLWQALIDWESNRIETEMQNQADNFRGTFDVFITSQINALERMGLRWDKRKVSSEQEWLADAQKYIEQLPIFQAIEWVDNSFHVRWITPLKGNESVLNLNLAFEERRRKTLTNARDQNSTTVSPPIILVQGGAGFLIYIPLTANNKFDGFIVGVIRINKLFSQLYLSPQFNNDFHYRVYDGDDLIFSSSAHSSAYSRYLKTSELSLQNVTWRLELVPSDIYLAKSKSILPNLVLISGLFAIALLFYFYYLRRREQVKTLLLQQEANRRINAEQQTKRLSERNKALFNCAPVGMIMVDKQGVIITANQEVQQLFGYQAEQLLGQSVDMLLPDALRSQHIQHRHDYMANPTPRKMTLGTELHGQRSDGSLFTLDIRLTPLEDENEGQVLASVIDITEMTQNKHRLTEYTAELEKANRELARSNKELNDFAYVASHDLKAPLRGIMQLANWIEEDLSDTLEDDTAEHLKLMQNRISRLEGLLDDLLAYSRIGLKHGDFKAFNIAKMANEIFQLLVPPAGFTLTCEDNLPEIVTLSVPLEQLLRNLINNAIKHHDKDEGNIHIACQPADKGYEFVVSDDGPGIPPDQHERVFRIFQTLRPRDEIEGSGMGLAIIKKLLDNYHCNISIESDGIRGTRMRFTWPDEATLRGLFND